MVLFSSIVDEGFIPIRASQNIHNFKEFFLLLGYSPIFRRKCICMVTMTLNIEDFLVWKYKVFLGRKRGTDHHFLSNIKDRGREEELCISVFGQEQEKRIDPEFAAGHPCFPHWVGPPWTTDSCSSKVRYWFWDVEFILLPCPCIEHKNGQKCTWDPRGPHLKVPAASKGRAESKSITELCMRSQWHLDWQIPFFIQRNHWITRRTEELKEKN